MKKLLCMIALGAISFGSVFAAAPARSVKTMQTDTVKTKKKVKKTKSGTTKIKVKKDSVKTKP